MTPRETPRTAGELTPTARAWIVLIISVAVVAIHAVELGAMTATEDHAARVVVVTTALPWLTGTAFSLRSLLNRTGTGPAAGSAALTVGSLGVALDGALSGVPGHDALCAVGLTGIALGLVIGGTRQTVLACSPVIVGGQLAMLLAAHGTTPRGWFVAAATASVTTGALGVGVWLQEQRRTALAELAAAAVHDPLTGLLNRRGMTERFAPLRASASDGRRMAVISLDLDHFKAVNDAHGHDVGDRVLVAVAGLLRSQTRSDDLVVRLGGEELAWVGAWHDVASAAAAAERFVSAVSEAAMPSDLHITVSAGVAFSTDATHAAPPAEALWRLLVRADAALYRAKEQGRDRVAVAPGRLPTGQDPHDVRAPAPRVRDGGFPVSPAGAVGAGGTQRA